ncbi:helix-turn-helix domain-containing protein [Paenibacillus thalictri]|uniref:AraC family transcriptional regulator n=1 Tax=Paenibacillus thalictri TaxID=2527873 RepID=A0A4V6MSD9_9BACL|nr:helix-turn-helix domain-containing protein [Paenibacillus thalictri]TBL72391.1 AraC family transcriptional regulator [Paenibacillus thalictri]
MKRRSIFYKYLLSYLLIGSIPVIVLGCVLYGNSVSQFQKEIASFHISKMNQAQLNMDNGISSLQKVALQISMDSKLSPYWITEGYRAIETTAQIKKYKEGNPLIREIFLYYRNSDMLHTSSGSFSTDSFKEYMFNDFGWNKPYFIDQLNAADSQRIEGSMSDDGHGVFDGNNTMAMFIPIPLYSSTPTGVVAIALEGSMLTGTVQQVVGNSDSDTFILDAAGKFLSVDNRGIQISQEQLSKLIHEHQSPGIYDFEYRGTPYSYLVTRSEKTHWSLISIVPKNELFRSVNHLRYFMIAILAVVALAAVASAIILSRRNYAPVRKLLNHVTSALARPGETEEPSLSGEWDVIQHTVSRTIEANRQMASKLHEQGPLIRQLWYSRLLDGTPLEEEEIQELKILSGWKGSKFVAAYVHLRGRSELEPGAKEALSSMYETLVFAGGQGVGVELHQDDAVSWIISLENVIDGKRVLAQKLLELSELANSRFSVQPIVGIGGIYDRLLDIHRSFIEAKGVIQYFPHQDSARAVYFDEYFTLSPEQFWYPLEEQVRLSQCLLHGDASLAEESIRRLFAKVAIMDQSLEMIRCIYYDIMNMVIKTANQLHADNVREDIQKLLQFQTVEQLETRLLALCGKLCEHALQAKTRKNESVISEITLYIQERFCDSALSLEAVAEHFGMTTSYLSKIFKQETNLTFTEYLKQLRLSEFKRGLVESDKSIKQLVVEIGYWDVPSFSRMFKQAEGMTPGDYRKLHMG